MLAKVFERRARLASMLQRFAGARGRIEFGFVALIASVMPTHKRDNYNRRELDLPV